MQYRAIGLIQGQYKMYSEQMTRGTLLASDGTAIDAVLLGRMISIVKKHLDLEQSHLWVVYPRNRKEKEDLHVQIVGVWEPETLAKDPPLDLVPQSASQVQHGYFSIRGEIIYHSKETETAIIKIEQSPKKGETKPKSSKLKLKGILPDKVLGHFWDLQVQLQGDTLIIQKATDICRLPPKKKPFGKKKGKQYPGNRFGRRKVSSNSRPTLKGKKSIGVKPSPSKAPLPKPIKRSQKKSQ
ncbi:MAG: hypothetical protein F6K10_08195 [Moorea sp. SIO2B7]|nr:hypothetical protein [Moorena sp. SIO2B7]